MGFCILVSCSRCTNQRKVPFLGKQQWIGKGADLYRKSRQKQQSRLLPEVLSPEGSSRAYSGRRFWIQIWFLVCLSQHHSQTPLQMSGTISFPAELLSRGATGTQSRSGEINLLTFPCQERREKTRKNGFACGLFWRMQLHCTCCLPVCFLFCVHLVPFCLSWHTLTITTFFWSRPWKWWFVATQGMGMHLVWETLKTKLTIHVEEVQMKDRKCFGSNSSGCKNCSGLRFHR